MKSTGHVPRTNLTPANPPPGSAVQGPRTHGRFPLEDLRFDNPNNACQSFRILAELVRAGDAKIMQQEVLGPAGVFMGSVRLHVIEPARGRG